MIVEGADRVKGDREKRGGRKEERERKKGERKDKRKKEKGGRREKEERGGRREKGTPVRPLIVALQVKKGTTLERF